MILPCKYKNIFNTIVRCKNSGKDGKMVLIFLKTARLYLHIIIHKKQWKT